MHIGILKAGHIPCKLKVKHADYWEMWFQAISHRCPSYEFSIFDIQNHEYPINIDTCDAYICTGSASSTYSNERWISELMDFVRKCYLKKKKFIGICFGHQAIAVALGGHCERSTFGWGVGIKTSYITKIKPWMQPDINSFNLIYSHQDQVINLPDIAEKISYSDHCLYTMFSIGDYMLGIQGHPEWSKGYAVDLLSLRSNVIEPSTLHEAMQTISRIFPDTNSILNWIIRFISDR